MERSSVCLKNYIWGSEFEKESRQFRPQLCWNQLYNFEESYKPNEIYCTKWNKKTQKTVKTGVKSSLRVKGYTWLTKLYNFLLINSKIFLQFSRQIKKLWIIFLLTKNVGILLYQVAYYTIKADIIKYYAHTRRHTYMYIS